MGEFDNLEEWMAKNMGPSVGAPSSTYRDTVRSELATLLSSLDGGMTVRERSDDPDDPAEGEAKFWLSDGTETGNDGDLLAKVTAGGQTYTQRMVVEISPSGITSGSTDYDAIQPHLTAGRHVRLDDGNYWFNQPLVLAQGAVLEGKGATNLYQHPGVTINTGYFVTVNTANGRIPCLINLNVYCNHRSRGVLFQNCFYSPLFENLLVHRSRQVGIDLVDCWGSSGRWAKSVDANGIALRTWRCNSLDINYISISLCDDDDWPAVDDDTVEDYSSTPVQTLAAERAAVCINSEASDQEDLTWLTNILFESNTMGAVPLVATQANTLRMNNVRFENNDCSSHAILVTGDGDRHGVVITFDNIIFQDNDADCPNLIEMTGTTRNVMVNNFRDLSDGATRYGISDAIISLESGTHYDPQVTNSRSTRLTPAAYIDASGATLNRTLVQSVGTLADASAPNNSIYYSSTQSDLCYKDSSGNVKVISNSAP